MKMKRSLLRLQPELDLEADEIALLLISTTITRKVQGLCEEAQKIR